jgi:hypothetical protein
MPSTTVSRRALNNWVSNGDFEYAPTFTAAQTSNNNFIDGTAPGSTSNAAYKWAIFGASGAGPTAQFDSSQSYRGSYSLKLSVPGTGQFIEVHRVRSTSANEARLRMIPILPSTAYVGTYWMKTSVTSGDATNGANVTFLQCDGSGTAVTSSTGTYIKTTTGWTQYTVSFTSHASARLLDIRPTIYAHQGAGNLIIDAWYDDITFGPATALTRTAI